MRCRLEPDREAKIPAIAGMDRWMDRTGNADGAGEVTLPGACGDRGRTPHPGVTEATARPGVTAATQGQTL